MLTGAGLERRRFGRAGRRHPRPHRRRRRWPRCSPSATRSCDASVVLDEVFTLAYDEAAALPGRRLRRGDHRARRRPGPRRTRSPTRRSRRARRRWRGGDRDRRALASVSDLAAQAIADLLDEAEYGSVAVGAALEDALATSTVEIVKVLAALGLHGAGRGRRAPRRRRRAGRRRGRHAQGRPRCSSPSTSPGRSTTSTRRPQPAAAAALEAAGYVVDEVALGLLGAYDATAAEVTQLLKDVEFTSVLIAGALVGVYDQLAAGTALLLHDVGFGVLQVADALELEFLRRRPMRPQPCWTTWATPSSRWRGAADHLRPPRPSTPRGLLDDLGADLPRRSPWCSRPPSTSRPRRWPPSSRHRRQRHRHRRGARGLVYGQTAAGAAQALRGRRYTFAGSARR